MVPDLYGSAVGNRELNSMLFLDGPPGRMIEVASTALRGSVHGTV